MYSSNKDTDNSAKKTMGTKSDSYRVYLRVNLSDILANDLFAANKANAKVQLTFAIAEGSADSSTFMLKVYDPRNGATDTAFSAITWNSVDKTSGIYKQLHWSNGSELVSSGVGHNISAENGKIVITLAYSQIENFVDANGNVLFAFATNTSGLKVASNESTTHAAPTFKVVLSNEHFHVFDQEAVQPQYLVSANCGEKAVYYKSCTCSEAGADTFESGAVINHNYVENSGQAKTCTEDGMKAHYRCSACSKYFVEKAGVKVETNAETLKIPAGHTYGELVTEQAKTCTEDGMKAHYRCSVCSKYFVEEEGEKVETNAETLKIPASHTYGELVPEQAKTCTTDGMKAHYRCTACSKYFVEEAGEKIETNEAALKISAGHTYGAWNNEVAATCAQTGTKAHQYCSVCEKNYDAAGNEIENLVIGKTNHTYE